MQWQRGSKWDISRQEFVECRRGRKRIVGYLPMQHTFRPKAWPCSSRVERWRGHQRIELVQVSWDSNWRKHQSVHNHMLADQSCQTADPEWRNVWQCVACAQIQIYYSKEGIIITHQKLNKLEVSILLLEASEIKNAEKRFTTRRQLAERFLDQIHAQPLAVQQLLILPTCKERQKPKVKEIGNGGSSTFSQRCQRFQHSVVSWWDLRFNIKKLRKFIKCDPNSQRSLRNIHLENALLRKRWWQAFPLYLGKCADKLPRWTLPSRWTLLWYPQPQTPFAIPAQLITTGSL